VNVQQAGFADTMRLNTVHDKSVMNKPRSQEVRWHYQIIRMTRASTAPTSNHPKAGLWTADWGLGGPKLSGPRGADCVVVSVCCVVCASEQSERRGRHEGTTRDQDQRRWEEGRGGSAVAVFSASLAVLWR
jgi:hypothetical protein